MLTTLERERQDNETAIKKFWEEIDRMRALIKELVEAAKLAKDWTNDTRKIVWLNELIEKADPTSTKRNRP